jgi:hypothetical protein
MYQSPEGDDREVLFIEVDGTPLLEPCSKGEQAYTGRVEIISSRPVTFSLITRASAAAPKR